MSEAASRKRATKQDWAVPGSTHDRIVRWTKVGLPMAAGILIAVLMLAPLDRGGDISFILDKKKVATANERMRAEKARYSGTDDKGQQFTLSANRAVQPTSNVPIVDIEGLFAQLALVQGPVRLAAQAGRYDLDRRFLSINGPVVVRGPDDYALQTSNVTVDLASRRLESAGPVRGRIGLGPFSAGKLKADLGERTVTLDGGARLKIEQRQDR